MTLIPIRLLVSLLGLLLLGGGGLDGEGPDAPSAVPPDTTRGVPAPDFALERLNGETFRLSDQEGTVVVLNIWATWCGPCRDEIPELAALQEEMRGEVLVVGVSIDERPPGVVGAHARKYGINYPVVIDDGTVVGQYGPLAGVPTTFVIDEAGRVRLKEAGSLTRKELRPVLRALVQGKVPDDVAPLERVNGPLGRSQ